MINYLALFLGGLLTICLFLIFHHLVTHKKCPKPKPNIGCMSKNGNTLWMNAISKYAGSSGSPDPNTNGYKKFCKHPSNKNWMIALSNANNGKTPIETNPDKNGYNDFINSCPGPVQPITVTPAP